MTSDKDEPLKNIQVIVRQDWNNGVFPADTIYTDENGEFKTEDLSIGGTVSYTHLDVYKRQSQH